MNYHNSLVSEDKHKIDGEDATIGGGISFPGQLGTNVGFEENSITHPWTGSTVNGQPGQSNNLNLDYSKWEYDYYPRGILSKAWTYNQEMNIPDSAKKSTWGNVYYSGWNYLNGGPVPTVNSGYWPTIAYAGASTPSESQADTAIASGSASFPLMPLMVTSSIAQYTQINTRLQKLRMRFVVANTTCYVEPGSVNTIIGACYTIQANGAGSAGTGIWGGTSNGATSTTVGPIGINTIAPQKICYGTSVQGPLGTGQCVPGSNNITRQLDFLANSPTGADSTFIPPENYTSLSVKLSELSIELADLSQVSSCMDSTQVIIQLQCSQANQCLSAYLQPGMFIYGGATQQAQSEGAGAGITASTGSGNQAYYKFIQACLLGSATYYLTDLCCQIPYESVDDEAYPIIRELSYMPQSYRSLRSQTDIITSTSSTFTQRISCGGSSLLQAVVCFFKPYFQPPNSSAHLRPQDTMVDYCNNSYVPSAGDLRAIPTMDSVYIPYTQASVQIDNKIYNVNPLTPINNPSYSTYLRSLDLCSQVYNGKVFGVDLRDYIINRNYLIIPLNTRNSREEMVVDQQLVITISFDDTARTAYSRAMGLYNAGQSANSYWLQSFILTNQSLINQDYVKI